MFCGHNAVSEATESTGGSTVDELNLLISWRVLVGSAIPL
jgi:hypothetical protein